jgi:hypothetical protein
MGKGNAKKLQKRISQQRQHPGGEAEQKDFTLYKVTILPEKTKLCPFGNHGWTRCSFHSRTKLRYSQARKNRVKSSVHAAYRNMPISGSSNSTCRAITSKKKPSPFILLKGDGLVDILLIQMSIRT